MQERITQKIYISTNCSENLYIRARNALKQNIPLIESVKKRNNISFIKPIAEEIRAKYQDVVVIGTGGSSLGGKTLCSLAKTKSPQIHFLENIDPLATESLINRLNLQKSFFIIISKSGTTLETLSQTLIFIPRIPLPSKQCIMISDKKDSALRAIAKHYDIKVYEHEEDIGGRYSVLTSVGLLPAAIAGLDIEAILDGASSYDEAMIIESAVAHVELAEKNYKSHILMPYRECLSNLTSWYRQLWAESVGKKGLGTTPIRALGTVDQHSQIQLYLDGPKDKWFSFITFDARGHGPDIKSPIKHADLDYFSGKKLGDILYAEQAATIGTFVKYKHPVRAINLADLSEQTIGMLLMHFMPETIAAANLWNVNPYDQPAVEDGKKLARDLLKKT